VGTNYILIATTDKGGIGTATIVMTLGANDLATMTMRSTRSGSSLVDVIIRKTTIKPWRGHANFTPSPTTQWKNVVSSRAFTRSRSSKATPLNRRESAIGATRRTRTRTRTHAINTSIHLMLSTPSSVGKSQLSPRGRGNSLKEPAWTWTAPTA